MAVQGLASKMAGRRGRGRRNKATFGRYTIKSTMGRGPGRSADAAESEEGGESITETLRQLDRPKNRGRDHGSSSEDESPRQNGGKTASTSGRANR